MRATAVIPVKRFDAAKQRLRPELTEGERREIAERMLGDVLDAVARAKSVERVIVVSGEPAAGAQAAGRGFELIADPADAGHVPAAELGTTRAIEEGAACAALLPGDCPLLDPAELDALLERTGSPSVTVIPDRHGTGTNGLILAPPDAVRPAFGPGSRARHTELAEAAGIPCTVEELPSLALDIDTAEDLELWRASS